MQIKKPKNFEELLNLQRILDETIDKPRENKFKPRHRNIYDMKMSIIAEVIEFNEETKFSHKTWKQKEFNEEKLKEEAIDILFFFLQLINRKVSDNRDFDLSFFQWEWKHLFEDNSIIVYSDELEMRIIKNISCDDIYRAFVNLIYLYIAYGISQNEVYSIYYEKWQKNMERINKDWTLKGEQNGNV